MWEKKKITRSPSFAKRNNLTNNVRKKEDHPVTEAKPVVEGEQRGEEKEKTSRHLEFFILRKIFYFVQSFWKFLYFLQSFWERYFVLCSHFENFSNFLQSFWKRYFVFCSHFENLSIFLQSFWERYLVLCSHFKKEDNVLCDYFETDIMFCAVNVRDLSPWDAGNVCGHF